ncbi:hypothetical protein [Opitutus terrae]|nr:hypothetical protein [Opitutus terrae]
MSSVALAKEEGLAKEEPPTVYSRSSPVDCPPSFSVADWCCY